MAGARARTHTHKLAADTRTLDGIRIYTRKYAFVHSHTRTRIRKTRAHWHTHTYTHTQTNAGGRKRRPKRSTVSLMGSGGRQPGHPEISQTGTDGIRKHCGQYCVPQSKRRWVDDPRTAVLMIMTLFRDSFPSSSFFFSFVSVTCEGPLTVRYVRSIRGSCSGDGRRKRLRICPDSGAAPFLKTFFHFLFRPMILRLLTPTRLLWPIFFFVMYVHLRIHNTTCVWVCDDLCVCTLKLTNRVCTYAVLMHLINNNIFKFLDYYDHPTPWTKVFHCFDKPISLPMSVNLIITLQ